MLRAVYHFREKARIPAWTDRILFKGSNLRQLSYNSAPLKFSDHRPVYATFQCKVNVVNEELRKEISQELYDWRKKEVGDTTATVDLEDTDDEDLIGYDSIEPGLPASSSDRQKWWLDNGRAAQAEILIPRRQDGDRPVLNPSRPSNPFTPTDEADWVSIPRSRLSSFSSLSSSPYEHVNVPNISSASGSRTTPRRLPPPFEPPGLVAKVGRMNISDGTGNGNGVAARPNQRTETPPLPPPRRQTAREAAAANASPLATNNKVQPALEQPPRLSSSTSQLSQQLKAKPAPPVAKKPAHLVTTSPASSPGLSSAKNGHYDPADSPSSRPTFPSQAQTGFQDAHTEADGRINRSGGVQKQPAPPPKSPRSRTAGADLTSDMQVRSQMGTSDQGRLHNNQAGRPEVPLKLQKKSPVDLLDSLGTEGNGRLGSWETLQPNSR
jgi:synaptojanin